MCSRMIPVPRRQSQQFSSLSHSALPGDRIGKENALTEDVPTLSLEEIRVVEHYVREHYDEVMEQDRRIRSRNAARATPPEIDDVLRRGGEKMEALREQFEKKDGRNGDLPSR